MSDEAEAKSYKFRHKTIRRFSVAGFEFENFHLIVVGDEERQRFLDIAKTLPKREALQIVEVNDTAAAAAEVSVVAESDGGVVRGAATAAELMTAADRERLKQFGTGGAPGATNTVSTANALAAAAAGIKK